MEFIIADVISPVTKILGFSYRILIRAPYTHQKSLFSTMRCVLIYVRLFLLLNTFNPDQSSSLVSSKYFILIKNFFFPFYSLLSQLPQEYQTDFWTLLFIHICIIGLFTLAKKLWKGELQLKITFYLMEIVLPDIFLFLVHNHLELSPFIDYPKTLAFFVTISLYTSTCIVAPIVMLYDREIYKNAYILQTGLKHVRREW